MAKKSSRKGAYKRRQHRLQAARATREQQDVSPLDWAYILKRELIEFAGDPRFKRAYREMVRQKLGLSGPRGEFEEIQTLDEFMLQFPLSDGRPLVEHYVDEHPDLEDAQRSMLLSWRTVVQSAFEVKGMEDDALVAINLVNNLTYRIHSNMGPELLASWSPGSFIIGRIVPFGDDWLLSGIHQLLPPGGRAQALQLAEKSAPAKVRPRLRLPFEITFKPG